MKEKVMEILKELRPDVDFESSQTLIAFWIPSTWSP